MLKAIAKFRKNSWMNLAKILITGGHRFEITKAILIDLFTIDVSA